MHADSQKLEFVIVTARLYIKKSFRWFSIIATKLEAYFECESTQRKGPAKVIAHPLQRDMSLCLHDDLVASDSVRRLINSNSPYTNHIIDLPPLTTLNRTEKNKINMQITEPKLN